MIWWQNGLLLCLSYSVSYIGNPLPESILIKSLKAIKANPPHTLGILAQQIDEDPFAVRPVVDKALREGLIKQFNGCFRITPSGKEELERSNLTP